MGPYRIRRPEARVGFADNGAAPADAEFRNYLDRLVRMIPSEVVGLYLVGRGVIPPEERTSHLVWPVVCLVGLVALRVYGTRDPEARKPAQWPAVAIASVAFVIWVYTLGGPFEILGVYKPYLGSLMVLTWTFFVPIFYRGD
jgi:hypothetical protein